MRVNLLLRYCSLVFLVFYISYIKLSFLYIIFLNKYNFYKLTEIIFCFSHLLLVRNIKGGISKCNFIRKQNRSAL